MPKVTSGYRKVDLILDLVNFHIGNKRCKIHELECLTNQLTFNKVDLCRWDESAACLLPDYLKKFFLKLISNFREFDNELGPHEKYRSAYNKKAVGQCYLIFRCSLLWFFKSYQYEIC